MEDGLLEHRDGECGEDWGKAVYGLGLEVRLGWCFGGVEMGFKNEGGLWSWGLCKVRGNRLRDEEIGWELGWQLGIGIMIEVEVGDGVEALRLG